MFRLFICLSCLLLTGAAYAQSDKKPAHEVLLEFFDRNEQAIAYHKHCVSAKKFPPVQFMDNASFVNFQLQDALVLQYPDQKRSVIEEKLLERGAYLQRKNTQDFADEGCDGIWGQIAKRHYDMVSKTETEFIESYILNRVNN